LCGAAPPDLLKGKWMVNLVERGIETIGKLQAMNYDKKKRIKELEDKYESTGVKCNAGHINNLPLSLWDCPMCTEDLRAELEKKQAIIDEQKEFCRTTGNDYQAKQIEVMGLNAVVERLVVALKKVTVSDKVIEQALKK
jgi:hypothetical protein